MRLKQKSFIPVSKTSDTKKQRKVAKKSKLRKNNPRRFRSYIAYAKIAGIFLIILTTTMIWLAGYPQQFYNKTIEKFYQTSALLGFKVKEITVQGRVNTNKQSLLKALHVSKGDPILAIDLQKIRFQVEKLEWVRHAAVIRRLPDLLQIKIDERRPIALWQHHQQLYLIDDDGTAIAAHNHWRYGVLPLVVGEGAPQKTPSILQIIKKYPIISSNLQALSRIRERRWNVYLAGNFVVKLSDQYLEKGLDLLEKLLAEKRIDTTIIKEIDLRSPERFFVRTSPETIQSIKNKRKEKAT